MEPPDPASMMDPEADCCSQLLLILSAIANEKHIQYGILTALAGESQDLGKSHMLGYVDKDGKQFLYTDPKQLKGVYCHKCSLILHIHTKQYTNIYKLKKEDRFYYQFTALLDMVGPHTNYPFLQLLRKNEAAFIDFFRFNAYRLTTCIKYGMSPYVQRLKSAELLYILFFHCHRRRHRQWMTRDQSNLALMNQVCAQFLDGSHGSDAYDRENMFYEELVVLMIHSFEKYTEKHVMQQYRKRYGLTEMNEMRERCRDILSKIYRMSRYRLIRCANTECRKGYLSHKYDIKSEKGAGAYVNGKYRGTRSTRRWFICSGCKCTYYCSRKCQKVAWNSSEQNHGALCRKLKI